MTGATLSALLLAMFAAGMVIGYVLPRAATPDELAALSRRQQALDAIRRDVDWLSQWCFTHEQAGSLARIKKNLEDMGDD